MPAKIHSLFGKQLKPILFGVLFCLLAAIGIFLLRSNKTDEHYTIGIIISNVEFNQEDLKMIKFIVQQKLESINKSGGINKRPVKVIYLDDGQNIEKLYEQVKQTSQDPNLIAYIGCKGSTRALKIAPLLAEKSIPFIGRYTLTHLFRNYPNAFSSETDFKDLTALFKQILKDNSKRGAFIGTKGDLYSKTLLQQMENLEHENSGFKVTLKEFFPTNHKLSPNEIETLSNSLKKQADFLVMVTETSYFDYLMKQLWKHQVDIPVYCGTAEIMQLETTNPAFIAGEFFDMNAYGMPGVQNTRIFEHLASFPRTVEPGSKLELQLGMAGRIADELGMIQEASQDKDLPATLSIREKIMHGLSKYVNGNKIYRGWFSDWYFTEDHGYAGNPVIAWKPRNFKFPLLAPSQFFYSDSANGIIHGLPVVYTNLDMLELDINNNEMATFNASFFLQLSSVQDIKIEAIEFINASRNNINKEPLVSYKLISSFQDNQPKKMYNHIYKVSGKFIFSPDMKRYPFDVQKFPIRIRSKNAMKPFLIQPPELSLRDTLFECTGWNYLNSYVGYEQELIAAGNDFSSLQKYISGNNFSFVYELNRGKVDFTLKTVIPLLALLIISYFTVYIPLWEFEALTAIQVTALLSAIALYFSTYKPMMEHAAISDKIFIFTYIMITSLIGTSIYLYARSRYKNTKIRAVCIYQQIIFPIIVLAFIIIVQT